MRGANDELKESLEEMRYGMLFILSLRFSVLLSLAPAYLCRKAA